LCAWHSRAACKAKLLLLRHELLLLLLLGLL
jgi:hypothetical protein